MLDRFTSHFTVYRLLFIYKYRIILMIETSLLISTIYLLGLSIPFLREL